MRAFLYALVCGMDVVYLGYLAYDAEWKKVFIPNEEVRQEVLRAVRKSGWNSREYVNFDIS